MKINEIASNVEANKQQLMANNIKNQNVYKSDIGGSSLKSAMEKNKNNPSIAKKAARQVGQQALSTAVSAKTGIPKGLIDKALNSKVGQKALNKAEERLKDQIPVIGQINRAARLAKGVKKAYNTLTGANEDNPEDQQQNDGWVNFEIPKKVLITAAIILVPVFTFMMIFVTMITQINSFNDLQPLKDAIDSADSLPLVEEAIDSVTYIEIDNSSKFRNTKLNSNLVPVAEKNDFQKELDEFYSTAAFYTEEFDDEIVYDFFYKLKYISEYYKQNYRVKLNIPLLMATLTTNEEDYGVVFKHNTLNYDKTTKTDNEYFSYDYDYSNYETLQYYSEHDIELLAQNMVSKQVRESCIDSSGQEVKTNTKYDSDETTLECGENETYETVDLGYKLDEEKYKNFLYEFLEKKYYTNAGKGDVPESGGSGSVVGSSASNELARAMLDLAEKERVRLNGRKDGSKYTSAYGGGYSGPWCAVFAWWLSKNTTVNGVSIYPDIVQYKSASTGYYMDYFMNSKDPGIKFYYNDSCSLYKGKNGKNVTYHPKPGDYIFINWEKNEWWLTSPPNGGRQDHTAVVRDYKDGIVYTVEGNMSSTILNRSYDETSCAIIGYGSWY